MPKFTILAEKTIPYSAVIEAADVQEAYELGQELPIDKFEELDARFHAYDVEPYEE